MITVIIFVAAYFAFLVVLALVVRPYRQRMVQLVHELEAENLNDSERDFLGTFISTAYSIRIAPMLVLVFLVGVLSSTRGLDRECAEVAELHPKLFNDDRMKELLEAHMASVAAVNPVFGLLAYLMRYAWRVRMKISRSKPRRPTDVVSRALSFNAALLS